MTKKKAQKLKEKYKLIGHIKSQYSVYTTASAFVLKVKKNYYRVKMVDWDMGKTSYKITSSFIKAKAIAKKWLKKIEKEEYEG